jgi:hypothetical protein
MVCRILDAVASPPHGAAARNIAALNEGPRVIDFDIPPL